MKKIVILTGSELRHTFFRTYLAAVPGIQVINTYCEGLEKSLNNIIKAQAEHTMRARHLMAREVSEEDFFSLYVNSATDLSSPIFLPKGGINDPEYYEPIIAAEPDLLIAFGCSLIKAPLAEHFAGKFLNLHLGLSPYYRGSGTNYWPLVNGEPELVGATFLHLDSGVDTGEIIHQLRARVAYGDTPSLIGNRLIKDATQTFARIILRFEQLKAMPQPQNDADGNYCRNRDFSEESVQTIYDNFRNGMIEDYIENYEERCRKSPLIANPALE